MTDFSAFRAPQRGSSGGGTVEVRRNVDRFTTVAPGRTTRHSFSFEEHYDPRNVGFGTLTCHNDDRLEPGHGYPPHPHRDVEIVTWVLQGRLRHEDALGHRAVVGPGSVQRTSAGSGVVHAEVAADEAPVRFVQVWLPPDEPGGSPSYDVADAGSGEGWLVVTSGLRRYAGSAATSVGNGSSALLVARLSDGGTVTLPEARWLHLFVATGEVDLEGAGRLAEGDAARLTGSGGQRVTAGAAAEVLLWEMHA